MRLTSKQFVLAGCLLASCGCSGSIAGNQFGTDGGSSSGGSSGGSGSSSGGGSSGSSGSSGGLGSSSGSGSGNSSGGTGSSSGGTGPDCAMFTACGGNLVGTWSLTKACFSSSFNPLAGSCPASAFSGTESINGTITFQADGSYAFSVATATVIEDLGVPASCINGLTCAQLQAAINMPKDAGAQPMGTCATTATGCACHVTQTSGPSSETGTYSTLGTSVTTTQAGGTPSTSPYCVQGRTLLIETPAGMMGAPGSGTVTIAATKQ